MALDMAVLLEERIRGRKREKNDNFEPDGGNKKVNRMGFGRGLCQGSSKRRKQFMESGPLGICPKRKIKITLKKSRELS